MRLLRVLAAGVCWILAVVLGLVGAIACVTVILLPLGIPLLLLSRRLFGYAARLFLPRSMTHPVDEVSKSLRKPVKRQKKKVGRMLRGRRKKIL